MTKGELSFTREQVRSAVQQTAGPQRSADQGMAGPQRSAEQGMAGPQRSAEEGMAGPQRSVEDRQDPRPWEEAGHRLGLRPGLAFMVATGVPADGSGVPELSDRLHGGPNLSSPQVLVNARAHNPLRNELVEAWVRGRAERELG